MKHLIYILFIGLILGSCKKDKSTGIQPVDLKVKVSYAIETSGYTLPVHGISVKIKNVNTGTIQSLNANEIGLITFSQIAAGTYDIDATIRITADNYTKLTGIPTATDITFNASAKNKQINVGFAEEIELALVSGQINDWVIKQVYYAGSHRVDGATFRDQFIEIYNNSDQVLYADGLSFAELVGIVDLPATKYHVLGSKQMDWSKSVNMPGNIDANNDYVYARALFTLPGTGQQYPVQPGKSIVIAQTALNHKAPFTDNNGKQVTVLNPSLTIDLSGADFEAYYGSFLTKPFASDVDTAVPNLEVVSYIGNDMILDNLGRYAYALLKADANTKLSNLPEYNYPTLAEPTSTSAKYRQIPNRLILDAVEVQPTLPADRIPKKLNPSLDAGFAFVPAGAYTSQSIIRKTEKTVNGRILLKDTNNSTEDFDFLTTANPRGFK